MKAGHAGEETADKVACSGWSAEATERPQLMAFNAGERQGKKVKMVGRC